MLIAIPTAQTPSSKAVIHYLLHLSYLLTWICYLFAPSLQNRINFLLKAHAQGRAPCAATLLDVHVRDKHGLVILGLPAANSGPHCNEGILLGFAQILH